MSKNKRGLSKKRMSLRLTQKTSMRGVVAATSISFALIGSFMYFNFFYNSKSNAETVQKSYRATYTTVDMNVPERLLLKEDVNARSVSGGSYKNDSLTENRKLSRGNVIVESRYITD